MTTEACPFCAPDAARVFYRDSLVIGLWDGFPVTPGHALLIPTRHVPTWFDASAEERSALMRAVDAARLAIESNFGADGFNIGINSGQAAGQTVFHLHVHVIPRRHGDVPDPRGGVRHVFPERANYIRDASPGAVNIAASEFRARSLFTGGTSDPLLPELKHQLGLSVAADIAVAFTLRSGLQLIQPHLQDVLDRGGRVRVITGDYLGATDPDALLRLLDLSGSATCWVYETEPRDTPSAFAGSFHPKAYLFELRDGRSTAIIGSSNLSESALRAGVEWNYRVQESVDRAGIEELRNAFESLLRSPNVVPLTPHWIAQYRARRTTTSSSVGAGIAPDPAVEVRTPHPIQAEALEALDATRAAGRRAGLVVLATGLGKTWLSAFDSRSFKRVLFVAHRDEILGQALVNFRAIRPHDTMGRYTGTEKSPDAAVLFASIQTLGRQNHLDRFGRKEFDYIVVDEFHHAEARTYRRLIEHFQPTFLLGLTATPERTDGADLLALCDNNLVYRCDLPEGIRRELLCPFRYFGVSDIVDYKNIPWRNKRFDEDELTKAVATLARAENALEQYRKRGGQRTIAFCVSQRHADFMAKYFSDNGVTSVAVHAGQTSAPRAESLEALNAGKLAILCAVDMFNEGVDVPELDTVLMLRPTESRIVWLQQFGRGLRRSSPEKRLTVIDYIGNHRSFLLKPQALFDLPPGDREVLNLLERLEAGTEDLPPGCEVTYQLEAKDILRALLSRSESAVDLLKRRYQDFRETLGTRPTASEMFREGYNPRAMHAVHGSWLGFVKAQGDLTHAEAEAFEDLRPMLSAFETTEMSKSYKFLVILALLNRNQLPGGLSTPEIAQEVSNIAARLPNIAADVGDVLADSESLRKMLIANPIAAWTGGKGTGGVNYFEFTNDTFRSNFSVAETAISGAQELIREIAEWRLAEYFQRSGRPPSDIAIKVSHSDGRPILLGLPRDANPEIPDGWSEVSIDGEQMTANFVKIAVNVVRRRGSDENILPDILKRWFGADAGRPGTKHSVILRQSGSNWELRPLIVRSSGVVPYKAYRRAEIAPLFGLPYSERYWGQGFVRQGSHTFLFVTLDKVGQTEAFQYNDRFIDPIAFQWQSQNRTAQSSDSGRSIHDHKALRISVHLFVRAKAKTPDGKGSSFYYCGPVEFVSWSGDRPITVLWKLSAPVPDSLRKELSVPSATEANQPLESH